MVNRIEFCKNDIKEKDFKDVRQVNISADKNSGTISKVIDVNEINRQNLSYEIEKRALQMVRDSPHREFHIRIKRDNNYTLDVVVSPIVGSA